MSPRQFWISFTYGCVLSAVGLALRAFASADWQFTAGFSFALGITTLLNGYLRSRRDLR